jgi:hypothetical protein
MMCVNLKVTSSLKLLFHTNQYWRFNLKRHKWLHFTKC